jgi:protein-S-isoprenylcysteine O-methyltransferase Ste14
MSLPAYTLSFVLAALGIFVIQRVFVRRDYLEHGRLRPATVVLQYVMVFIWVAFGWLNMPPRWPTITVGSFLQVVGWVLFPAGLLLFAAAFSNLGVGRSHGGHDGKIQQAGLYRITRNPQILGFGTFMVGFTVLWPTWRMVGVLILMGFLAHLMVLTEEEFLLMHGGEEYEAYRRRVPRYLGRLRGM